MNTSPKYEIEFVACGSGPDTRNDNVDVIVEFETGECYAATFFTLNNIRNIMDRYSASRECLGGLYFWSSSMIVVRDLERATIEATIRDLVSSGEFFSVFDGPA